jgi:polysaccharide pyruvyl transferase WcaK-like protein
MADVNIVGWYNHGNIGDESYKICFPKLFPDIQFSFTEKVGKNKLLPTILGGGNVCSNAFLDQIEHVKSKKFAISVGITEENPIKRMEMFDEIYVRETKSQEILESKGIKSKLIPDLAFCLEPNKNKGKELLDNLFKINNRDLYEKVVGVVFNAYLCVGDNKLARDESTFQKVTWDIAKVIDNTSASFVFIPFGLSQPHDDRVSNAWLASRCKFWKKNLVLFDKHDPQTTLDLISACDTVISTRLHSSIFSTVSNVPFIDVTHHSKNSSFVESIYKRNWSVPYWEFERLKFSNLLGEFLEKAGDHDLGKIVSDKRFILGSLHKNVCFM